MQSHHPLARALATAFLQGAWNAEELSRHAYDLTGRKWRWIRPLVERLLLEFFNRNPFRSGRPRHAAVVTFIEQDHGFLRACEKHELTAKNRLIGPAAMSPASAAAHWMVPAIRTPGELADWLELSVGELDWFADYRHLDRKPYRPRLAHYRYRTLSKRFGHVRLIESPKPRLKAIQRTILAKILDKIPPHDAAQGFRRGSSICTFAARHVGQRVVLRLDLRDFFPSVSFAQVHALFRTIGYPERVADLLTGLCTHATPDGIWESSSWAAVDSSANEPMHKVRRRYAKPHLPQGAPTSPALANLCAYRLDCRLAALAESSGAVYTRYADDLAFSGGEEFRRSAQRFHLHACAIVMEEGFGTHDRKTRIMRSSVRQQLAGVVVNQHLNVRRGDYDRLKAILTNCIRFGPDGQNRDGHCDFRRHLQGRISFVQMVNPARGKKLRELYERIVW